MHRLRVKVGDIAAMAERMGWLLEHPGDAAAMGAAGRIRVAERFSPEALQALLQRPGRDTWLLYPDVPTSLAPSGPGTPAGAALRLVVLDATWAIVEFIQFLRKRPFPQRMRAGAYWG